MRTLKKNGSNNFYKKKKMKYLVNFFFLIPLIILLFNFNILFSITILSMFLNRNLVKVIYYYFSL